MKNHPFAIATPPLPPMPAWKRFVDLACCLVALPLLTLLTLFLTILTRLVSPGPVFFRQERVGLKGRRFYIYKFRTMHVNAATNSHQAYYKHLMASGEPMQKLDSKGDQRLIPLAWMLRASGLDELPQVINILRGEMSVVGPRPCVPYEFEEYEPWQRRRFDSTPGLTGLWQVSGKNRLSFAEMVQLDLRYARERNPALDLRIILLTVPALLIQIGETRRARRAREVRPIAATTARPVFHGQSPGAQLKSS
jgi:lipopolysaccharide/colanic/teichoic acid biosynthesis glycosyltransferase